MGSAAAPAARAPECAVRYAEAPAAAAALRRGIAKAFDDEFLDFVLARTHVHYKKVNSYHESFRDHRERPRIFGLAISSISQRSRRRRRVRALG